MMKVNKMTIDPKRLLGFRLLESDAEAAHLEGSTLGAKVGNKSPALGPKVGGKSPLLGAKVGKKSPLLGAKLVKKG